jgi:hypothetical protein
MRSRITPARLAAQGPGNEAAADPLVAGSAELTLEPSLLVAVTATLQAEATSTRHRRRELAAGDPSIGAQMTGCLTCSRSLSRVDMTTCAIAISTA